MLVKITQEDIDQGDKYNPGWCPVALAVKRTTGNKDVSVGFWVHVDGTIYRLANRISDWIYRFDQGGTVRPITFRLTRRDPLRDSDG